MNEFGDCENLYQNKEMNLIDWFLQLNSLDQLTVLILIIGIIGLWIYSLLKTFDLVS